MKTASISVAIAALALSLSTLAFAQGRGNDRDNHRGNDRGADRGHQQGHGNARGNPHRTPPPARYDRRPGPDHRYSRDGRGAGPEHNFYRGGRLPPNYRSRQYVVEDWRGHRLNAPPRGYHWVQAGGDYVLVAITTGVILSILLNN